MRTQIPAARATTYTQRAHSTHACAHAARLAGAASRTGRGRRGPRACHSPGRQRADLVEPEAPVPTPGGRPRGRGAGSVAPGSGGLGWSESGALGLPRCPARPDRRGEGARVPRLPGPSPSLSLSSHGCCPRRSCSGDGWRDSLGAAFLPSLSTCPSAHSFGL